MHLPEAIPAKLGLVSSMFLSTTRAPADVTGSLTSIGAPHRTEVVVNKRAVHYLYLDGREEFNRFVLSDMENVNKRKRGP